ncbi:MAG TPA: FGGY family carbohydrate kinase [Acidimicrobiales bacterium]|nr:FGGY family carbohydrate kinase [Acidimicrobiales bacterium]
MTGGRVYVGLDLGSSAMKGVLLDRHGVTAARATRRYATQRPEPGASEQDPGSWLLAVREILAELSASVPSAEWAGIGLSGMIPTLVVLDERLAPVRHAITWEDRRAEHHGRSVREIVGDTALYRATGQRVDGRYLLPMYLGLAEREPSVVSRAISICSAKDYLLAWLTGELVTDPSTATGYGCFALATGTWHDATLAAAAQIAPGPLPALPPVRPSTDQLPIAADTALALGLPASIRVCVGGADSVLGAAGLGVRGPGEVAYIAGSSTVIIAVTPELRLDDGLPYLVTPLATAAGWGLETDQLTTGSALTWLAKVLLDSGSVARCAELAESVAPEDAPVFLPFLGGGEQGALWDPALSGAVVGLDLRHDRRHLARALLNGILMESRRCLAVLDRAGAAGPTIQVAGASATMPAFRVDLADATRRSVSMPAGGEADCSAAGAALLAAQSIDGRVIVRAPQASGPALSPARVDPDESRSRRWDAIAARHDEVLAALGPYFAADRPVGGSSR